MSSEHNRPQATLDPSDSPAVSGNTSHEPLTSKQITKGEASVDEGVEKTRKLADMQAEEMKSVKEAYAEHEDKFGNRE